ncbi:uncharacterized protein LOC131614897 [Vicia villosa]|uniref:uncharacterized protein LOC131614897 n=1 Tax=Vicia villosa TaxID=3911 RepID=UPI00273BC816|nr:uncharacterized protein LOC131614897 [Vicia villosa]
MVQCYYCNRFGHFAKDCWSNKEEAKIARGDSDDEPVLLMAYESDEEPVSLSFSYSEGEEDNSEYSEGVFLYDSKLEDDFEDSGEESESEVSEDESELEEDSEAEDKSESEGGTSEGGASEGSPASDGGHDSERKDYEVGTSEDRASDGDPTSKGGGFEQDPEVNKDGTSGGSQTSEENPEGDMVPESEGDFELLGTEEALEKKEVAHCSNQKKLADVLMKDVKTGHLIRLRDGVGVVDFG